MADRVSWLAVDKYQADPLCDGEEDDRKWKQAVKEAKEERDKRKSYPARRDRGSGPSSYGASSGGYGGYSRDRRSYGGRQ